MDVSKIRRWASYSLMAFVGLGSFGAAVADAAMEQKDDPSKVTTEIPARGDLVPLSVSQEANAFRINPRAARDIFEEVSRRTGDEEVQEILIVSAKGDTVRVSNKSILEM